MNAAFAPLAQHDKLQAVLAKARAIRGQDQPAVAAATKPLSQSGKASSTSRKQISPAKATAGHLHANSASSVHNKFNKSGEPKSSRSNSSKQASRSVKQPSFAARPTPVHQKQPQHHTPKGQLSQREAAAAVQSDRPPESSNRQSHSSDRQSQPRQAMPLHLPADFQKALNALR